MSDRLRTWLFQLVFYGLSVPIVLFGPAAGLISSQAMRDYARGWTRFHRWCARRLVGIRVAVEGEMPTGPVLYAAKHQAMFETLELTDLLGAPAIVMKQELARIPVFGWVTRRYGMIVVDREASSKALRGMMRDARVALAEGRSVMIFPEGTRVAPGETPPLRSGFAGLYRVLGLPVVPVALDSGLVWPRKGPKHAGVVTFRFGEPIPAGLPREEVEARVHAGINALETSA